MFHAYIFIISFHGFVALSLWRPSPVVPQKREPPVCFVVRRTTSFRWRRWELEARKEASLMGHRKATFLWPPRSTTLDPVRADSTALMNQQGRCFYCSDQTRTKMQIGDPETQRVGGSTTLTPPSRRARGTDFEVQFFLRLRRKFPCELPWPSRSTSQIALPDGPVSLSSPLRPGEVGVAVRNVVGRAECVLPLGCFPAAKTFWTPK